MSKYVALSDNWRFEWENLLRNIIIDEKNNIICMPVLSLAKIIHFRFKYFQHSDLIYYEIFPKYLRVINKIFKKRNY